MGVNENAERDRLATLIVGSIGIDGSHIQRELAIEDVKRLLREHPLRQDGYRRQVAAQVMAALASINHTQAITEKARLAWVCADALIEFESEERVFMAGGS